MKPVHLKFKAILFDLDGTLVDSAPDLATSINRVLAEEYLGPLTEAQVRKMIGNGVRVLVERAFAACNAPHGDLDSRTARMLEIYEGHSTVDTRLMPGVEAALDWCRQQDLYCAVVTNKPEAPARDILAHCGIVMPVIGGDAGYPLKPAPDALLAALALLGAAPGEALMVGDSVMDVTAARAAGIASLAVGGGYTDLAPNQLGADSAIATLADMAKAVERWR